MQTETDARNVTQKKFAHFMDILSKGDMAAYQAIKREGFDLSIIFVEFQTNALHYAAMNPHEEVVRALLTENIERIKASKPYLDINLKDNSNNMPIFYAAKHGRVANICALIEYGAEFTFNAGSDPYSIDNAMSGLRGERRLIKQVEQYLAEREKKLKLQQEKKLLVMLKKKRTVKMNQ